MDQMEIFLEEAAKKMTSVRAAFGAEKMKALSIFEDCPCYPVDQVIALTIMAREIQEEGNAEKREKMIADFVALRDSVQKKPDAPEAIILWPEGKIPTLTEYTDNKDYKYNHDPDFVPHMFEMLIPEDQTPKGAIVLCAGGDHAETVPAEAYQVGLDFNEMGYQCFLLLNRPNRNPWNEREVGADSARAIRIIRKNAAKYRIPENRIAFAGFSNGGLTGEACIQYFSGTRTMADSFPNYVPDELDAYYGGPDAFLCVYGPRFVGEPFDYENVIYPPTFFAVGREDSAVDNLNYVYPQLIEHGVKVEVHTFAGTPHGQGGRKIEDGVVKYPNFEMWEVLADYFMQDAYK